jgi:hypothetical protein
VWRGFSRVWSSLALLRLPTTPEDERERDAHGEMDDIDVAASVWAAMLEC